MITQYAANSQAITPFTTITARCRCGREARTTAKTARGPPPSVQRLAHHASPDAQRARACSPRKVMTNAAKLSAVKLQRQIVR